MWTTTWYFAALQKQMDHGGREAMLWDLMHRDISGVNLRKPPATAALWEQKVRSMSPEQGSVPTEWLGTLRTASARSVRAAGRAVAARRESYVDSSASRREAVEGPARTSLQAGGARNRGAEARANRSRACADSATLSSQRVMSKQAKRVGRLVRDRLPFYWLHATSSLGQSSVSQPTNKDGSARFAASAR